MFKFYLCALVCLLFPSIVVGQVEITELQLEGYNDIIPKGVSNTDIVVGHGNKAAGPINYLFWHDLNGKTTTEIEINDSFHSMGINSNGTEAVGFQRDKGPTWGFLFNPIDGQRFFRYTAEPYAHTRAMDVNNDGVVVGYVSVPMVGGLLPSRGFIYIDDSEFIIIDYPQSMNSTEFISINDSNIVVGTADNGLYTFNYNIDTGEFVQLSGPQDRWFRSLQSDTFNAIQDPQGDSFESNNRSELGYSIADWYDRGVVYDLDTGLSETIEYEQRPFADQYLTGLNDQGSFVGSYEQEIEGEFVRRAFIGKRYTDIPLMYGHFRSAYYPWADLLFLDIDSYVVGNLGQVDLYENKKVGMTIEITFTDFASDGSVIRIRHEESLCTYVEPGNWRYEINTCGI